MNDDDLINICQFTPVFITLMKAMSTSEGHENGSLYGCKSPFTLYLEHADRDTGRRLGGHWADLWDSDAPFSQLVSQPA